MIQKQQWHLLRFVQDIQPNLSHVIKFYVIVEPASALRQRVRCISRCCRLVCCHPLLLQPLEDMGIPSYQVCTSEDVVPEMYGTCKLGREDAVRSCFQFSAQNHTDMCKQSTLTQCLVFLCACV